VHSDQTENAHHSSRIVCPCCPGIKPAFKTFALLMKHQSLQHNIQFEQQTLKFDAKDAFIKWKEHEETATNAFYMKNAECESTEGKVEYFECHRSNFTKFVSKPSVRAPKISGSIKIDGVCPARLVVRHQSNAANISAEYFKTHVGHTEDIKCQPIPVIAEHSDVLHVTPAYINLNALATNQP
jgi:hypothetical protein